MLATKRSALALGLGSLCVFALWHLFWPETPAPVNPDRLPWTMELSPGEGPEPQVASRLTVAESVTEDSPCVVDNRIGGRAIAGYSNRTVPDVEIALHTPGGDIIEVTKSDVNGKFRFAGSTEVADWALTARHEEFALRTIASVDVIDEEQIEIALTAKVSIAGRVTNADGAAVSSVRIVAWHERHPSPGLRAIGEGARNLLYHHTITNSDGSFEIGHLCENASYFVAAGGGGYAQIDRATPHPSGSRDLELVVQPVYALFVTMRQESGEPPRSYPALWTFPGTTWAEPEGLTIVDEESPSVLLNESIRAIVETRRSAHSLMAVYVSNQDVDRLGPMELDLAVPGYQRTSPRDIYAVRARSDAALRQVINMQNDSVGFGTLIVALEGFEGRPWGSQSGEKVLLVPLDRQRVGVRYYECAVAPNEPKTTIEGVPSGEYEAHLDGPLLSGRLRPGHVFVKDGATSEVALSTGDWGSIDPRIVLGSGCQHLGSVSITVTGPLEYDGRSSVNFGFKEPPYTICGIWPGTYRVLARDVGFQTERVETVVFNRQVSPIVLYVDGDVP